MPPCCYVRLFWLLRYGFMYACMLCVYVYGISGALPICRYTHICAFERDERTPHGTTPDCPIAGAETPAIMMGMHKDGNALTHARLVSRVSLPFNCYHIPADGMCRGRGAVSERSVYIVSVGLLIAGRRQACDPYATMFGVFVFCSPSRARAL